MLPCDAAPSTLFYPGGSDSMPRGVAPRQPARTGRAEGTRMARALSAQGTPKERSPRRAAQQPTALSTKRAGKGRKQGTYDPLAPDRVAEILKRLDQLYPDVPCALTHRSAWGVLVANTLSAQ